MGLISDKTVNEVETILTRQLNFNRNLDLASKPKIIYEFLDTFNKNLKSARKQSLAETRKLHEREQLFAGAAARFREAIDFNSQQIIGLLIL